jgi:hypothetical protein
MIRVYGATKMEEINHSDLYWAKRKSNIINDIKKEYNIKNPLFVDDTKLNIDHVNVDSFLAEKPIIENKKLQNKIEKCNNDALIFDFDLTLTKNHSGGVPFLDKNNVAIKANFNDIVCNKKYISSLSFLLNKYIKKHKIFVVTRGLENEIQKCIDFIFNYERWEDYINSEKVEIPEYNMVLDIDSVKKCCLKLKYNEIKTLHDRVYVYSKRMKNWYKIKTI